MSYILAKNFPKQKGSLLGGSTEAMTLLVGGLVLLSVFGGLAYGVYNVVFATSEWSALNGLVAAAHRNFQGETYPATGIDTALIKNNDYGNLRISSNTILNTYGQAYTFGQAASGGNFTVSDPGVPQPDCIKILKQVPNSGYISVAVNGGSAITTFPITQVAAQTACSVATTAGNTILVQAQ